MSEGPGPGSQAALEAELARMAAESGQLELVDAVTTLEAMASTFLGTSLRRAGATGPGALDRPAPDKAAARAEAARAEAAQAPECLVVIDAAGTIIGWSEGATALFGWTAGEAVGRGLSWLLVSAEARGVPAPGQLARRRDGTTFTLQRSVSTFTVGGAQHHALSIVDDDARQREQEALRRSHARYRMLVEQIPAVTFMAALDESENEIYIGPQIEALLGYTQREWLDDPVLWYWRMHPDDRLRWNEEFARGIQTGGPFRNECRFFARDGRTVWVHGEARVVRDEDGRPMFVQGVAFDISEQKRAEQHIRDAQAMVVRNERLAAVGQLAAGVAHDLRNPLGAIRNAWHFISRKLALKAATTDARVRQMSEIIEQELARCAQIIGELLDFSRSRPPFLTPCPLRELVADAKRVVARVHEGTELPEDLPDDLPVPNLDRGQIRQVVVNLIQNAVEVVPPQGGRVLVRGRAASLADGAPAVLIEVIDNGPGIPREMQEKIFEPLFTTKIKGTGLGLAVVETFVRRHGGAISVESAPGQGATFRLLLPVATPSQGEAPLQGGAADLRDA